MVRLFKQERYEVVVAPEALLLPVFKQIWDRDKSADKHVAMQELSFIYFVGDPRSDYQYIVDKEVRIDEVAKALAIEDGWEPDDAVLSGLEFYESLKPMSSGLLEDTRYFVSKFREELRSRADELGKLNMRDLKEALALLKQIPSLSKDLDEAERNLNKDIMSETQARGSKEKAFGEDEDEEEDDEE